MGRRFETVSFLSDYGTADEFVGVVRSVIRSMAPHVTVVDLTHELAPFDVRAASLSLVRAVQYLAPGVVLAVVDPGVGTDRRAVAVEVGDAGEAVFVGPDNGLLAPAVAMTGGARRAVALTAAEHRLPAPGPTFAGRDVFAPAVAHLCCGGELTDLGDEIDPSSLVPGMVPLSRTEDDGIHCEVLWTDRFGNAQLNVDPDEVAAFGDAVTIVRGDDVRTARRVTTYADLRQGEVGLLIDSYGLLAVVLDRRSASDELTLSAGTRVVLRESS